MDEQEVQDLLSSIPDPRLGNDIVSLGLVNSITIEESTIKISLVLGAPYSTEEQLIAKQIRDLFSNSRKIVTRNIIKNKATEIISGCVKNIKPIDDEIDQSIKNWRFDRINSVDLNILRIAVYEILFSRGIPVPVSIKEAIVLALKYSSDESCSFINGILDSISKRALQ